MSSKVKDGLFLGDIDAAQDAEFLQLNGIVHIVNCVPRQVPNLFQQSLGLAYVACELDEVLKRSFFDLKNRQFMAIVQLIDRALEKTESVLVHSLNGVNRSPSVMMGYLMVKYCWGVDKAYEFLLSKRADIKPHESYIEQLCLLEAQLQGRFGSRATEQQLYEWHPSLADPLTDELVLIHTYLNTPSNAPKPNAKKDPVKPPGTRRLSWIDQIPQMKKLYPSLMIKPERPPNNSYSEMQPADGWVDLLAPANASTTAPSGSNAVPRPIAAFMDTPVSHSSIAALASRNHPVDADEDESEVSRGHRVHSFSVPRRREIEVDNALSPSSTSSERDEPDLTIDVAPLASSSASGTAKQATQVPRYQQQIRGSTTTTPSNRPTRQQLQTQTQQPQATASTLMSSSRLLPSRGSLSSSMGAMNLSASLPASGGRVSSSFSGPSTGSVTSTVMASSLNKTAASKALDYTKPTKPGVRPSSSSAASTAKNAPTSASNKQPLERRSSAGTSNGSYSARGTYTGDLPLPQTTSAFTIRRSIIDTDSWAATAAAFPSSSSASSSTARPRTAPPRLRKKDADVSTSKSSGVSRVNIDVWSLPTSSSASTAGRRLSSGLDYAAPPAKSSAKSAPGSTTGKPASATATAAAASATRPRPARAQWK